MVEHCCSIPSLLQGETLNGIAKDLDTYSYKLPLGVCAGIAPFNFPAMVPLWMFPVAITVGNTYVMKVRINLWWRCLFKKLIVPLFYSLIFNFLFLFKAIWARSRGLHDAAGTFEWGRLPTWCCQCLPWNPWLCEFHLWPPRYQGHLICWWWPSRKSQRQKLIITIVSSL